MTLKSTSAPLDAYIQSEWRTQLCTIGGIDYTALDTNWATILDAIIDEGFEQLSQRAAHHPWGQAQATVTITAGTNGTYSMPADFRHLISIYETAADGSSILGSQSTAEHYWNAQGGAAHPWTTAKAPVWFFDGLTSGQPPVQQWRRVGADNSGATAYILYRPYFNLLASSGQDAYPYLPPAEGKALREQMLEDWWAARKMPEMSQFHRARKEDAISALEKNDRATVEAPQRMGTDPDFARQLG